MTILVTGSTGKVGSTLLEELRKHDVTVRALVRKPDAKLPDGVEAVVGDLLDPVSVGKALDGVDKLYLLNGVVPDELTQGLIAFGLARKLSSKVRCGNSTCPSPSSGPTILSKMTSR